MINTRNIKIPCAVCGGKYTTPNKKKHTRTKKHLRALAQVVQEEKVDNKHQCEVCGGSFTDKNKTHHQKTKKHIAAAALAQKTAKYDADREYSKRQEKGELLRLHMMAFVNEWRKRERFYDDLNPDRKNKTLQDEQDRFMRM